jgi:CubicO group peptidase (beta-lactamase class C family)
MTKIIETLFILFLSGLLTHNVYGQSAAPKDTDERVEFSIPDTPVGRVLKGFISVVNLGDAKQIDTFARQHFATNKVVKDSWPTRCCAFEDVFRTLSNVAKRSGGLVLDEIHPQNTAIVAFARTKIGSKRLYISLETSAKTPERIQNYQIVVMPPDMAQFLPKPPAPAPFRQRLGLAQHALEKAAAQDLFSGTFIVARHGEVLLSAAYGQADRQSRTPIRLDTPFGIASTGKLFTAVAVAQLVSKGKLSYDEPISSYLPDYPNKVVASKISLHQLLTHSSGLGDIFSKGRPNIPLRQLSDYYPLFADEPLLFEPGKGQAYSNTGFLVASMIVERVSGEEFHHYLQKHIFAPASMTNTGWDLQGVAHPYTRDSGDDPLALDAPWVSAAGFYKDLLGGPAAGQGGEDSTAQDLLRFAVALQTGKLLDLKNLDILIQKGYGCQCSAQVDHRIYSHSGGGPGVNTGLKLYVDQDFALVFLSNYDPPFPQVLANEIADFLGEPDKRPNK